MVKKGSFLGRIATWTGFAALAFTAVSGAAVPARAEEETKPLTFDTTVGFVSDYMFRGFNLYDGSSIQPSIAATYDTGHGKISANLWMHLSAEGDRDAEKFTEMDETISYAIELSSVTLEVGHIWYNYPDDSDEIVDTAEFYASVTLDDSELSPFSLSPSFSIHEDYREFDTQYYELGFSHLFEPEALGKGFNATPYVTFGFASNAEKVYDDEQGLVQITYGVSSELPLGDFSVVPALNYTHKVDDATVNEFWFATNLNYSF